MRKVLFLLAVLAFVVAAPVYAANVGGTWALSMAGPQGDENFDIVIVDNSGSLQVSATHPMLQAMEGTGTLKGNDINFTLKATGQMAVELAFTGKVTGKKMEGTREIQMASGGGGGQGGGQGGPGGAQGDAAAGGGQGGPPSGGESGAPAGGAQGGPPSGGEGGAPSGGQGGAPGGGGQGGGGGGGDMSSISNAWSAVMK